MTSLMAPLNDEELKLLDRCLLERIDEDEDTEDQDEGVLDVSMLDGLFTALVSGPVTIPPSQWMPAVWGDYEPEWESKAEFENITALMMRLMNCIAATLMEDEEFEPLFMEGEEDGEIFIVVDEWCEGYMRGVALAAEQWQAGGPEIEQLLTPIRAFTSETDWQAHELATEDEIDELSDSLAPSVREIHSLWLARRES